MDRKNARAHKIKDKIFIQGYAETTVGLNQLDGPVFVTEGEKEHTQLGEHILKALEGAGKIIPHPTQEQWKEMDKNDPMLQSAKMKTWNALMKVSKSVRVELQNNKMTIIPYRFGGTRGDNKGYHDLTDKAITCTDLDPETLGRALIQAFELCE